MFGVYSILIIFAVQDVICERSFTIVLDTTASMRDEINIIRNKMPKVIEAAKHNNFGKYILIPFGDNVGPPIILHKPEYLIDLMNLVEVSGGNECPEDSLAAIENALLVGEARSLIFVFTDAQAQRSDKLSSIQTLCQKHQSQVVIFLSGHCVPKRVSELENENIYYEIAKNCDGSVFNFDFNLNNFREALKYIIEITRVDWSEINSPAKFTDNKQFTFTMDTYTKDFIVAVSGNYPTITIKNVFGDSPSIEKIVDSRAILVIRVVNAEVGEYTTDVTSKGTALATFYRKKEISFRVGFSPLKPLSLRETTPKPLPEVHGYMLISLPDTSAIELTSVQLQMTDNMEIESLVHRILDGSKNTYLAEVEFAQKRPFRVIITCTDKVNFEELRGTSGILEPQTMVISPERSVPEVHLMEQESNLVDFGTTYTGICKVDAIPKPEIWWEDDSGKLLPSESALLQSPSVYISYVIISSARRNTTITCKSRNDEGEGAAGLNVYVNRTFTFKVLQAPTDMTIEFGKEAKLYCEADTYPEADIKWYHNDTLVEESDDLQLLTDEHALFIKSLGLDDTGDYKCEISNEVQTESFSATIFITGLELPKVQVEVTEIVLKPGEFTEEECIVLNGIPTPEIKWKYKDNNEELQNLPEGVTTDGNFLKIPAAELAHGGFYVCEAINVLGTDAQEVAVKVQYPPKIKNADEAKVVNVGDLVELPCDVEAIPKANVQWDFQRDDMKMDLEDHHQTDDRYTHRFYAHYKDSGIYQCVAENAMGRAVRTVTLNVLVGPYIEPLPWEVLSVRSGETVVLHCNVTFGNPVPSTKWEFISPSYVTTVLKRAHSMGSLDLVLTNVSRTQHGTYQCISENQVSPDIIKVHLKVS